MEAQKQITVTVTMLVDVADWENFKADNSREDIVESFAARMTEVFGNTEVLTTAEVIDLTAEDPEAPKIGQHVTITDPAVAARYIGVVWTVEFLRKLQDGTPVAHLVSTEDAKEGKGAMRRLDSVPVAALTTAP